MSDISFHHQFEHAATTVVGRAASSTYVSRDVRYRFTPHYHPYVADLVGALLEESVEGLQGADTDYRRNPDGTFETLPDGRPRPTLHEALFTGARYDPTSLVPSDGRPVADLDFSVRGAYAVYNWELFFHVPLAIAIHLSRNQRFEEAQRWFHHVFDPTTSSTDPAPGRYWGVRPFQSAEVRSITEVLTNLSTRQDPALAADTVASIGAWKDAPFRPHLVARYRQTAYMHKAVMSYLDNLVAWGDALFREDTGESINEALQLYVMAANILGPRPQEAPRKGWQRARTYDDLRADLDAMSNLLTEVEVDIPFDALPHPTGSSSGAPLASLQSIAGNLHFCVPRNDTLLGYWDTVADRLFKIRNSLDLQGVFRQLPLFEPPIDPALLAKGAAAGLDTAAIVAGLRQPLPLVRFSVLVAKANELCQEVRSLGGHLLSAMEKEDGETLSILRARHERVTLGMAEVVRYEQWQDAIKAREGLERSFESVVQRYRHYEQLLGRAASDIDVPPLDELDVAALEGMRFRSEEPAVAPRDVPVDIWGDLEETGGRLLSQQEAAELRFLWEGQLFQEGATALEGLAGLVALLPELEVAAKPTGVGAGARFGGSNISKALTASATVARTIAGRLSYEAGRAGKLAGYERREQDWAMQANAAAAEISQIYKQWRGAQIREAVAERELRNHQQQMRHAEEVETFLTDERAGKATNRQLYAWLRREVRGLHAQCFQLAHDVARRAERALQHELGDPTRTFVQAGYQAGKHGLLAGEKLHLDLKRMELAYQEQHRREYELTTNVSLRQLDPVALLRLRATGSCEFTLPEALFDLDAPGHYFRRIKSVALSIPSVVGPYTGIHATLTLTRSSVRTTPSLAGGYERVGEDADRFNDHFGGVESIVTSTGHNDAGMFETNLRDERYLPFEGSGAISGWRLELPAGLPRFDWGTISDVVLQVRYTAREGGAPMRREAARAVEVAARDAAGVGSVRLLSMRTEFPSEWARFRSNELDGGRVESPLEVELRQEHYPFWARALGPIELREVELFADPGPASGSVVTVGTLPHDHDDREDTELDVSDPALGDMRVGSLGGPLPAAIGPLTLHVDDTGLADLWLALHWGAT